MNSVWQQLTLSTLPLQQWLNASYLHYLVGPLRKWRKGSRLMQWAELIGGVLVMLVFGLAPFVNNLLTGVLLALCGAYWVLLTVSDERHDARGTRREDAEVKEVGEGKEPFLSSYSPLPTPHSPLSTPIHLLILLYWAIASVATAMSPVKREAFTGWTKLTLFLLFFALMARVLRSPQIRSWVTGVYLHTALIVSTYGIHQRIFGAEALATWVDPTSLSAKEERVYSFLGNPNLLAGYLLPAVALSAMAFFAWRHRGPKLLALVMVLMNSACLYFTGSRGGWLGFVAMSLILLVLLVYWVNIYLPRFWRTWALPVALGGLAGAFLLGLVVVEPLRDRVSSVFAGRGDSSNNFRINVWQAVVEMIQDHPAGRPIPNYILGVGPGNTVFNKIYPLYQRPRYSALSAYSIVLEVAVETGITGLTCFLWLVLVTLTQGWRALQRLRETTNREGFWLMAAIATLVGMFGHGLVDTVLYRPEVNTLWWLMFALIASYYSYQPPAISDQPEPADYSEPSP